MADFGISHLEAALLRMNASAQKESLPPVNGWLARGDTLTVFHPFSASYILSSMLVYTAIDKVIIACTPGKMQECIERRFGKHEER